MLENQMWFEPEEALRISWRQGMDEGRDIGLDQVEMETVSGLPRKDPQKRKKADRMLERWESAKMRPEYCWREPDILKDIIAESDGFISDQQRTECRFSKKRVHAAWTLRAAGCLLGKPVEGWYQNRIEKLLQETGNLPVHRYLLGEVPDGMPEDDDTNYTILALKLMEERGWDFTPDDVGEIWLSSLPILHLCTAERVAYINMVNGLDPPQTARYHNAYREYIGAQIRGDFFGYVCPGDPQTAAKLAWRDASVSHVKNGIYGEMFVAAMLAKAAATSKMQDIIRTGLAYIPKKSRLHAAVSKVLCWKESGISAREAIQKIHNRFDETCGYDWCHVIPNAMIVAVSLLCGENDFGKAMDICLRAAFDTDCNCATVGSVIGMAVGIRETDQNWIEPLKDKIHSGVDGMGTVSISELTERTQRIYEKRKEMAR